MLNSSFKRFGRYPVHGQAIKWLVSPACFHWFEKKIICGNLRKAPGHQVNRHTLCNEWLQAIGGTYHPKMKRFVQATTPWNDCEMIPINLWFHNPATRHTDAFSKVNLNITIAPNDTRWCFQILLLQLRKMSNLTNISFHIAGSTKNNF